MNLKKMDSNSKRHLDIGHLLLCDRLWSGIYCAKHDEVKRENVKSSAYLHHSAVILLKEKQKEAWCDVSLVSMRTGWIENEGGGSERE